MDSFSLLSMVLWRIFTEQSNLKSKSTSLKDIPIPGFFTKIFVMASSSMELNVIVIGIVNDPLLMSWGMVKLGVSCSLINKRFDSMTVCIRNIASLHEILQIPLARDLGCVIMSRSRISSCGIVGKSTFCTLIPLFKISNFFLDGEFKAVDNFSRTRSLKELSPNTASLNLNDMTMLKFLAVVFFCYNCYRFYVLRIFHDSSNWSLFTTRLHGPFSNLIYKFFALCLKQFSPI
ncbi:hypothetical protein AWRI1631_70410 [Saccharomyces cerevisiae AWRI1631]|uniref:Uncharacterized protein n=1 Tax=Saccharomyces cerevisiae (strain AWRI1631) TaxID=545124 RepID=B5VIB9_YEAS6|nr:hypothetical protein AWRI1631_70410 [Saccharomyces cerevisiae AWRI1631]